MPKTIYMSTSDLENAVATLLNAGCLEDRADAEKVADRQLEHVFPITVGDPVDKIALMDHVPVVVLIAAAFAAAARVYAVWKEKREHNARDRRRLAREAAAAS